MEVYDVEQCNIIDIPPHTPWHFGLKQAHFYKSGACVWVSIPV
jgi:hypothetical protein